MLVYGLVINLQNFGIDQSYVQRYVTARSDQAARRSVGWRAALPPDRRGVLFCRDRPARAV